MKKFVSMMTLGAVLAWAVLAFAAVTPENPKVTLKAGDEVYVCGCGPACPCGTLAKKEGKCSCDKPMVKASVVKVEDGKAKVKIGDKEQEFKTAGKFVCGCGAACPCDTISQNPGKCACGKDLVAAK